jgi:hypothetical protein
MLYSTLLSPRTSVFSSVPYSGVSDAISLAADGLVRDLQVDYDTCTDLGVVNMTIGVTAVFGLV